MHEKKALEEIKDIVKQHLKKNKEVIIPGKNRISIGKPIYNEDELVAVTKALLENRISQGKYVMKFEKLFANYVGVKHAIAVNSGSSANLMALATFIENGDVGPGDEVIVPAATFSTVAFPIIQLGLVPVFVDVEEKSYNIDVNEIKKAISRKTKILMPVHSLGNPADMEEIKIIGENHNLKILEDCCEAHGACIGRKVVGTFSDMSTISFFVAHNMTTGEGGMILTNSGRYNNLLSSIREFGRISQEGSRFLEIKRLGIYDRRYIFERLGYNFRMTELQASIGIEQLKKLDQFNKKRIDNAMYYIKALSEYKNLIQLPVIKEGTKHTFYGFLIAVREDAPFTRMELVNFLEQNLIETRPFFAGCLPDQPALHNKKIKVIGNLPVSRWLRDNAFFVGCHPAIGKIEREYVIEKLRSFLEKF